MPVENASIFGSEFWAAIVGAIVGGGVSIAGQSWATSRQEKAKNAALGNAVLFKLVQMHSNVAHIKGHLDESAAVAAERGMWLSQATTPLALEPSPIIITPDEKTLVMSLGDDDLFNVIITIDDIYNTFIQLNATYIPLRQAATFGTNTSLDPYGRSFFVSTVEEAARVEPALWTASNLVRMWRVDAEKNERDILFAMQSLQLALKLHYKLRLTMVLKDAKAVTPSPADPQKTS